MSVAAASIGEAKAVWLKPAEIAQELDIAYTSVLAYIHRRELRAYGFGTDGGKPYRVRQTDYLAWLERRAVASAGATSTDPATVPGEERADGPADERTPRGRGRKNGRAAQRSGGGRRLKPKPLISLA